MAHWRRTLALDIVDVRYETFVSDRKKQVRRVTDFLGLSALASSRVSEDSAQDVVTTANVWQVRQPVYTHAVERWRSYASYLPELAALFAG